MSGNRPGPPLTVTDEYLAAILDELRALRAERPQVDPPASTGGRVDLKEPAPARREGEG